VIRSALLVSLGCLLESGADLDLEVLDLVHHFLALLGDGVGGVGLQAGDLALGDGEGAVHGTGGGSLASFHIGDSVGGQRAECGQEGIGFVLDFIDELITVVAEPVDSLLALLLDTIEDLLEDSIDLVLGDSLLLCEISFIWVLNFSLRLSDYSRS